MIRRLVWMGMAVLAGTALLAGIILLVRGDAARRERVELRSLRARHAALRDSLNALLQRSPLPGMAYGDSSSVAVALSESLIVRLAHDLSTLYLHRIQIDLTDIDGHGKGDIERDSPIGKVTLGTWNVNVTVDMTATLAALAPVVDIADSNRVRVALPVEITEGHGGVTLDFKWDSKSVFNAVCHDFETRQVLTGRLLPQRHLVRGDFVLSARERAIVARPTFPPEKFPLSMDLDAASWERIRTALEQEDKLSRCGILIDPDVIVPMLRKLGVSGLKFKMPRAAFRDITLPASVSPSVSILGRQVDLVVRPHTLRVTPDHVWYGADVRAMRAGVVGPLR